MKHETHTGYDPDRTALAEQTLLSVWGSLRPWHDDLVLVGGLVPRYLCDPPINYFELPHPATLDVDFGIALGTESRGYDPISTVLEGQGFAAHPGQPHRYVKTIGAQEVYVDFLTEEDRAERGTVAVDDIAASVMPGMNRALRTARTVEISGKDLQGALQDATVRVCEVGPFLALKLRAFLDRKEGKDAFDILYTLQRYDRGLDAAIAAYAEEVRVGNPACVDAQRCLATLFPTEEAVGPVRASHFVLGPATASDTEDTRIRRAQIRQDMVDVAAALCAAGAAAGGPSK
jgi:hypothetical protein